MQRQVLKRAACPYLSRCPFQAIPILCIMPGGGGHFHTSEYWACAAGQGAFFESPALACVIIIIG